MKSFNAYERAKISTLLPHYNPVSAKDLWKERHKSLTQISTRNKNSGWSSRRDFFCYEHIKNLFCIKCVNFIRDRPNLDVARSFHIFFHTFFSPKNNRRRQLTWPDAFIYTNSPLMVWFILELYRKFNFILFIQNKRGAKFKRSVRKKSS